VEDNVVGEHCGRRFGVVRLDRGAEAMHRDLLWSGPS
jgi:hypothetical protein